MNLTRGNGEALLARASFRAEREREENLFRLTLEAAYGQTRTADAGTPERDEETAKNAQARTSWKRLWGRLYVYGDTCVLYDGVADIAYRAIASPGVGYFFVKTDSLRVSAEAGPAYVVEEVAGRSDEYWGGRIAERIEARTGVASKMWQSAEYVPQTGEWEDFLLNAEVGVETRVEGNLSLRVVTQERYDATPAAGKKRTDFILCAGVSLKLW